MPHQLVTFILALFISLQVRAEFVISENRPIEANSQAGSATASGASSTTLPGIAAGIASEANSSGDSITEADSKTTYLMCKSKSRVRTLRVLKEKNGSCVTTYTKNGVDQKVSHSGSADRCSKVLANIRINLEKSNWKCKDISEARVSSSE